MVKGREIQYDLLKTLCVFSVIILHVNATVLWEKENVLLLIHNTINYLTRFAVPCFFMISGAFMMKKNKNIRDIIVTVIYKLFMPFIVMTVVWIIILVFNSHGKNLWDNVINPVLICNYGALWFVPSICIMYLITPLLCSVSTLSSTTGYRKILIVYSIWTLISTIVSENFAPYSIGVIGSFLVYYLWGGYIYKTDVTGKQIIILFFASFVLSIIALYMRMTGFEMYIFDAYRSYFSPSVFLMSIFVFCLFRYMSKNNTNINIVIRIFSEIIAKYSIYIYLLHRMIVIALVKMIEKYLHLNVIITIIVVSLLTLLISLTLGFIWNTFREWANKKFEIKTRINTVVDYIYKLE